MKRILISNDDGINAPGIVALRDAVKPIGEVYMVAPDRERSTVSHALSLTRPLRIKEIDDNTFAVDGTPSDCVNIAMAHILKGKEPDLIISGINHGPNLGSDTIYSGTVAAAMEGALCGVPSMAVSLAGVAKEYSEFRISGHWARRIGSAVIEKGLPDGVILNVNVPPGEVEIRGYKFTNMGKRMYSKVVDRRKDSFGAYYFWLAGKLLNREEAQGTDCREILNDHVTITPLKVDNTDYDLLKEITDWDL